MKLKTRLRVTFAAMIGLPLLLTVLAFVAIGFYLVNMDKGLGFREMDYSMMSESIEEFIYSNDQVYDYLKEQAAVDGLVKLVNSGFSE